MARPKEFDPDTVLDRAMLAFWTSGYEGTSTHALTEHMGIGKRSLYDTFGDKRRLYLQSLRAYVTWMQTSARDAADAADSPAEALLALLTPARRPGGQPTGCFAVLAATEAAHDDAEVRTIVGDFFRRTEDAVAELARAMGVPARESAGLARIVHDAALGVRVRGRAGLGDLGELAALVALVEARAV